MKEEQTLLSLLQQQWEEVGTYRVVQEEGFWQGALELPDENYEGMCSQIEAGLQWTVPLYCHPQSDFYGNEELLRVIDGQVDYLLRTQFASGCVSLINCNIDSPPDTGFAVHIAALSYHALASVDDTAARETSSKLQQFLRNTIPCLLTGGIHTPNHRWVISGALALLYELFPEDALRERADAYFAEGLDMNEAGEWTERSNAIYNAVCCNFLYHAYRIFGYEDLMAPIESNLAMMKYMLHPDGAIVTEYSSRQDRGKAIHLSDEYYIAFKLMAFHTNNGEFDAMADEALRHLKNPGLPLLYWMKLPEQMGSERVRLPLPRSYELFLNEGNEAPVYGGLPQIRTAYHSGSPVVRFRQESLSVTIASGQPEFLFVQYGAARMTGLRWSLGWFGIAGAPMAKLVKRDDRSYELSIELEGNYHGPLKDAAVGRTGRSVFDFSKVGRDKTHSSKLELKVSITLRDDGVQAAFTTDGATNIFSQLVCSFDTSGEAEAGENSRRLDEHLVLLRSGTLIYRKGEDVIEVTGGGEEHRYACLRNDRMEEGLLHVVSNHVTPMQTLLNIQCRKDKEGVSEA